MKLNRVLLLWLAVFLHPVTNCVASTDTYVIDSESSRLSYIGPNAFPGPCPVQCDFQLSGSFEGSLGLDFLTISNPNFTLEGEYAAEIDVAAVQAQFPRTARLVRPGFLSLDTNILNVLIGFGEAFAVQLPEQINLVAGNLRRGLDGPSYAFDVTVFSSNQLDCDGDDEITFEDIKCLERSVLIRTVLDYTDTIVGDTDGDQVVGFSDFLNLSNNFGRAGGYTQGDLDLNGTVNFADFLTLSRNFGEMAMPEASFSAVPEPDSEVLWVAALLFLWRLGTSRRMPD